MTLIGYARVSTVDQDPALQINALTTAGVHPDQMYIERASGAATDRPQLAAALKALRPHDVFTVWKLDRLGRSVPDLVRTLDDLRRRDVEFVSLTERVDTTTAQGRLLFGVLAVLAEFERDLIRERTLAGLAAARANGRTGGRPPRLTPAMIRQIRLARAQHPPVPIADLARAFSVGRSTIYRAVQRLALP